MKNKRIGKMGTKILMILMACLMFGGVSAFAADALPKTIEIPVFAAGADCTAVLYGADGTELQRLLLKSDETSFFTVTANRLGTLNYTIRLADTDTDAVTYDKTEYSLDIELYGNNDGSVVHVILAYPRGAFVDRESGKAGKLEFANVVNPTPDDPNPAPVQIDPPVKKRVEGSPETRATFTFVMDAVSNTAGLAQMPMPGGAQAQRATMQIIGEGEGEFGVITFETPGVYVYSVAEQKTDAAGYTFDATVYTVTAQVTRGEDDALAVQTTITRDGTSVDQIVFTNVYTAPDETDKTPTSTGSTPTSTDTTQTSTGTTPSAVSPTPTVSASSTGSSTQTSSSSTSTSSSSTSSSGTGGTPQTGDERNLALWLSLSGISFGMIVLLAFVYIRRRRKDRADR